MEKYCRAGQTIDDNMAHVHCMIVPKATNTRTQFCVKLIVFFHSNNDCTKAPECYMYNACLVQIIVN